ncbi:Nif3-like dinuclear metal center hexameric protein [Fusobacterium sp.]|uniref:Nif3-like dinuclear metal center hexameric protein n=1 Tax=Fusobacterium sp. TaxID=68766 RepID=UPI00396CF6E0
MMVKDVIKLFEQRFPVKNAEDWDNVGLLVGDRKSEVKKIQVSLDATEKAIDHAVENEVDMIITHHPMIFKGIKNIDYSTVLGRKIIKLIRNGITLYAMHTNLDATKGGLNDFVVELLGATGTAVLDENIEEAGTGIGRVYTLDKSITVKEYADLVKNTFEIPRVRIISENIEKNIRKIAVVNGSGMSYWRKVKSLGADLFITGDIGYHEALDAKESGMSLIDIGHFESETCFTKLLKKVLEDLKLEVIIYNDGPVFISY